MKFSLKDELINPDLGMAWKLNRRKVKILYVAVASEQVVDGG
jgi:hypothetical protein